MRVGLALPQLGPYVDAETVRGFCRDAEGVGFASLWAQEHLFYPHENASGYAGRDNPTIHEAYRSVLSATELLAFAAACTSRVTIGSSILVAGYHRPVELAQAVSTLDVLSGGRFVAGLSVGWSDEEHAQMDVDPRTRGRRLDEMLAALQACWGPDPVRFHGEFFDIPVSDIRPKPIQRPHPPLLSGMRSEAGLRRTARWFDIWNPSRGTPAELRDQMEQMAQLRPEGMAPIRLYLRSYTQRPTDPVGKDAGQGVAGVLRDLDAAREAGAEELIVDANFSDDIVSPSAWRRVPESLLPVLQAAQDG